MLRLLGALLPQDESAMDRCANCGSDQRLAVPYFVGRVEMQDVYCGTCGVTWGNRLSEQEKATRKIERKAATPPWRDR